MPGRLTAVGPLDLLILLAGTPLSAFAVALLLGLLLLVLRNRSLQARTVEVPEPYRTEWTALALGAVAVILAFLVEHVVSGYVLNLADIVGWWRYATPLIAALVVVAVVAGMIGRRRIRPDRPAPRQHRSWADFGRPHLLGAVVAVILLVAVTVGAGMESRPDRLGRYVHVELPVPNQDVDPMRPWFYGWAYGVPVLICLALLAGAAVVALRMNAMRPYRKGDPAERQAREEVARGIAGTAGAATLLALGAALRFVADARIAQVTVEDRTYEVVWRHAELAALGGWLAPVLEIVAFVALLRIAAGALPTPARVPVETRERAA